MKKITRRDLILIVGVLILAAVGFLVNYAMRQKNATLVEISIDGSVTASYSLYDEVDLVLDTYHGGTNHLIIHDGAARITEASCPDHICINQGQISENGEMIVCLPNRLIVRIAEP